MTWLTARLPTRSPSTWLKQAAKDAGNEAGIDLGAGDKAAEKLFDDLTHGKNISDSTSDAARQLGGDAAHAAGGDTDSAKGALDAIAHTGDGTDSGDHPPFALTSSDLHHAGSARHEQQRRTRHARVQSLMSQRQEAVQETTQILQDVSDTTRAVLGNIGDDSGSSNGNSNSGDGNSGSDGDHPPGWPFAAVVDDTHHAGAAEAELTATTEAVDTPSFVSNLVDGTYDHIVQSSVQHMSDAAPVSAIEGDFWSEAAQAVNGSSATTLETGAQVISSVSNAVDPGAHSNGEGPGEAMGGDFGYNIASVETAHTPVIDHFAAPTPIEIVHAPEFATHMHL